MEANVNVQAMGNAKHIHTHTHTHTHKAIFQLQCDLYSVKSQNTRTVHRVAEISYLCKKKTSYSIIYNTKKVVF
jgi:hypothetical protein